MPWTLLELKNSYRTIFVSKLCAGFSAKANSFIDYYGKKKDSDVCALHKYLGNGSRSKAAELSAYNAMNNAGYMNL